jgi:hypothetical protein
LYHTGLYKFKFKLPLFLDIGDGRFLVRNRDPVSEERGAEGSEVSELNEEELSRGRVRVSRAGCPLTLDKLDTACWREVWDGVGFVYSSVRHEEWE